MPPLKIGYLTQKDALDPHIWSGTIHRMYRALAEHAGDVEIIGPRPRPLWLRVLWHYLNGIRRLFGQKLGIVQSVPLSLAYGWYFSRQLEKSQCDVVFAPIAACELAFLRSRKPIVYFSDTTFAAQIGYYFKPSDLSWLGRWEGLYLERRMVQRASALIYASDWAADCAVQDDGADKAKIHVAPLGANFKLAPTRDTLQHGSTDGRCRLLFVSRDWDRKGGRIAFDTLQALRRSGIDAELTVVGCVPPSTLSSDAMHVIASLNKDIPEQAERLAQLFRAADFFLLPTRAECFGVVFCEASAYGLPSVTTRTGGVPTAVAEGVNGTLLPLDAEGQDYAVVIAALWQDRDRYRRLRQTTRQRFEDELNWQAWAVKVRTVLQEQQLTGVSC